MSQSTEAKHAQPGAARWKGVGEEFPVLKHATREARPLINPTDRGPQTADHLTVVCPVPGDHKRHQR
ncbi:hypothetical protein GCM10011578_033310 [Streptomyces fuscichromogenes]|uniref:Uncharacterized protein n=1 Tax=Streptomyces fuscichromogenes TaxID=1324013 RepID=A0A917XCD2_9ACTN|nr:hypothetical protein GCM10011578_033310 [Streptomyces fuscichromogenes]